MRPVDDAGARHCQGSEVEASGAVQGEEENKVLRSHRCTREWLECRFTPYRAFRGSSDGVHDVYAIFNS